jgi:linoleoyl-CoA desaturase
MTIASAPSASAPKSEPVSPVVPIAKQNYVKAVPFTGQRGFRKTLNKRVEDYLSANNIKSRDLPAMYVKSGVVLALWALTLAGYLAFGAAGQYALALICAVLFGTFVACVGFNIMHDANHGGYSNHPLVNKILSYSAELVGLSTFMWRQQHNVWHHTFTNIAGLDEGLETEGWLRSSPKDFWEPKHQLQHLYAPIVYAVAGASLMLVRNYKVYFTGKSGEHFVYPKMTRDDKIAFWLGRALNLIVYIVLPALLLPWPLALAGFICSTIAAGLVFSHVLMLAHIHDGLEFVEPVGDPLHVENEWAVHQVITTMNFSPNSRFINWFVGGLNYQIEHHLFPQLCHMVYPKIAPIVEQTCKEFGVSYKSDPSFWHAIAEHYRSLKTFGMRPQAA